MRIMAISDLHGNLEGLDLKSAAVGLLPKRSVFRFAWKLKVPYAFQVVKDLPYENVDLFKCERPMIAPAMTFLSQLL